MRLFKLQLLNLITIILYYVLCERRGNDFYINAL